MIYPRRLNSLLTQIAVTCSLATIAAPSQAHAQTPVEALSEDEQRQMIEAISAAKKAYNDGRFEESLAAYTRAYAILPEPELMYRIGLCHERLDQPSEAIEAYTRYLDLAPTTNRRGRVTRSIDTLRERVSPTIRLSIKTEGASVTLDGAPVTGASPYEIKPTPGTHTLRVEAPDHVPRTEQITASAGETLVLSWKLTPAPTKPVDTAAKPDVIVPAQQVESAGLSTRSIVGWSLAGVSTAGALTCLFIASGHQDTSRDTDLFREQAQDDATQANIYSGAAIGLGVLALGGLGLALWPSDDDDQSAMVITATGSGVAATWRW